MSETNCGNCRHFVKLPSTNNVGSCRRYPPNPAIASVTVSAFQVCGEHAPREKPLGRISDLPNEARPSGVLGHTNEELREVTREINSAVERARGTLYAYLAGCLSRGVPIKGSLKGMRLVITEERNPNEHPGLVAPYRELTLKVD